MELWGRAETRLLCLLVLLYPGQLALKCGLWTMSHLITTSAGPRKGVRCRIQSLAVPLLQCLGWPCWMFLLLVFPGLPVLHEVPRAAFYPRSLPLPHRFLSGFGTGLLWKTGSAVLTHIGSLRSQSSLAWLATLPGSYHSAAGSTTGSIKASIFPPKGIRPSCSIHLGLPYLNL